MTITELKKEIAHYMKGGHTNAVSVLRSVLATAQNMAIEAKSEVTEAIIDAALLKEQKTLQEMIDTCPTDREKLHAEYMVKHGIVSAYAPKMIDNPDEIKALIEEILDAAGLDGNPNRGQIMKAVMPKLKGKADMKVANQVISQMF